MNPIKEGNRIMEFLDRHENEGWPELPVRILDGVVGYYPTQPIAENRTLNLSNMLVDGQSLDTLPQCLQRDALLPLVWDSIKDEMPVIAPWVCLAIVSNKTIPKIIRLIKNSGAMKKEAWRISALGPAHFGLAKRMKANKTPRKAAAIAPSRRKGTICATTRIPQMPRSDSITALEARGARAMRRPGNGDVHVRGRQRSLLKSERNAEQHHRNEYRAAW